METGDPIQDFDAYADSTRGKSKRVRASILAPIVSFVAASLWAYLSYVGHAQIGYMALGVGILVGGSIRLFCQPVGKMFAFIAAAYSFFGVLLGNLWTIGLFATEEMRLTFSQLILGMDYSEALEFHFRYFDGHDIAFYGLSIAAAFRIAYVRLKHDELDFMLKQKGVEIQKRTRGSRHRR